MTHTSACKDLNGAYARARGHGKQQAAPCAGNVRDALEELGERILLKHIPNARRRMVCLPSKQAHLHALAAVVPAATRPLPPYPPRVDTTCGC